MNDKICKEIDNLLNHYHEKLSEVRLMQDEEIISFYSGAVVALRRLHSNIKNGRKDENTNTKN